MQGDATAQVSEEVFQASVQVSGRKARLLVLAMLICLHVAVIRGVEDIWARGLMMAHLGLFMIWQPFMQGGQKLKASELFLIVLITVGILAFLNWWMLGMWVALPAVAPASLPRLTEVRLDGPALVFGLAVSLLTGLLSGTLPAFRGARTGLASAMTDGDVRSTGSAR